MKCLIFALLLPQTSLAGTFVPSSFSANFEESFVSAATGKEKKSFGKIDYQYPAQIRYDKTSPDPSAFVSNARKSWYYVPPFVAGEEGQVTIQESSKLPLTKFLDSIKDGVAGSKLFTSRHEGKELILTFVKAVQDDMTLKEVRLLAPKEARAAQKLSEFEKITLVYVDGRKVNLKFLELKEGVTFGPKHFEFTIPPKTKISNQ